MSGTFKNSRIHEIFCKNLWFSKEWLKWLHPSPQYLFDGIKGNVDTKMIELEVTFWLKFEFIMAFSEESFKKVHEVKSISFF